MRPIRLKSSREINMLEGPLLSKIFAFVLPLMLTNLLQMCYSAADMIIVGLSDVEGAIGAIGTTGALINLILNVFAGFAIGTSVVVARNIGKGDRQATESAVHTSLLIGLISGVACAAIGLVICRPILASMGAQGHILDLATLYTNIYFAGVPFLALTNFEIAILRAKGDTRTSLYILASTGVINVVLNLFFVLVLDMSVDGVALATTISNAASMALLAIRLLNDEGWCRLSFKKLRIDRRAMFEIIRDGLPAGVQGALFSFSNMLIQSSVIGINNTVCPGGSDIIDGNAAAANLESLAYVAAASVSQASVTFTSQHFGAGKFRRMGRVMANCYLVYGGRLGHSARPRQTDHLHNHLAHRLLPAAHDLALDDLSGVADARNDLPVLSGIVGPDGADAPDRLSAGAPPAPSRRGGRTGARGNRVAAFGRPAADAGRIDSHPAPRHMRRSSACCACRS